VEDPSCIQDLPISKKIIDAVTIILMHNREVLATTAYAPCGSIVLADLDSRKGSVGTMPAQVKSDDEFDINYFTTPATQKRLSIATSPTQR